MQIAQQQHPRKDEDPGISLEIGSFFATKIKVGIFLSTIRVFLISFRVWFDFKSYIELKDLYQSEN